MLQYLLLPPSASGPFSGAFVSFMTSRPVPSNWSASRFAPRSRGLNEHRRVRHSRFLGFFATSGPVSNEGADGLVVGCVVSHMPREEESTSNSRLSIASLTSCEAWRREFASCFFCVPAWCCCRDRIEADSANTYISWREVLGNECYTCDEWRSLVKAGLPETVVVG